MPEESFYESTAQLRGVGGEKLTLEKTSKSPHKEITASPLTECINKEKIRKKLRLPLYHITDEECWVLFPEALVPQ